MIITLNAIVLNDASTKVFSGLSARIPFFAALIQHIPSTFSFITEISAASMFCIWLYLFKEAETSVLNVMNGLSAEERTRCDHVSPPSKKKIVLPRHAPEDSLFCYHSPVEFLRSLMNYNNTGSRSCEMKSILHDVCRCCGSQYFSIFVACRWKSTSSNNG